MTRIKKTKPETQEFRLSDEIIDKFLMLSSVRKDTQLQIGDEINREATRQGVETSKIVNAIAGALRINASTLYDYARVSKKWTEKNRIEYEALDWTIIRNADPIADKKILDKAVDEGWNASRFKNEKYPEVDNAGVVLRSIIGKIDRILTGKNESIPDSVRNDPMFFPMLAEAKATIIKAKMLLDD